MIKDCIFEGPYSIDKGSCIVRSTVGSYFGMNWHSFVSDTDVGRYCTVGSRVSIGAFSHPTDWLSVHEFQFRSGLKHLGEVEGQNLRRTLPVDRVRTYLGPDVWICDNAVVLAGVNIGAGAIVGAGAVVTKDLLPYGVYVGNPCRLVRFRFCDSIISRLMELKWWELSIDALAKVEFNYIEKAIEQVQDIRKRRSY